MIKMSVELVNATLGYLGTRPYQEVYQLIAAIQAATVAGKTEAVPEQDQQTDSAS